MNAAVDASISVGALSVQPGGTGVILAGTGDPNDELDSYYGSGILRSADQGKTWTLIAKSQDWQKGLANQDFGFYGEGFAGFAWSSVNTQLVVAAVSQSAEGELVGAEADGTSYKGLYYSPDAGATWLLARITDGNGHDVQGPLDGYAAGNGNAATSVVWNPVRKIFLAALRFHGFYQSSDGIIWTRLAGQPGAGLTAAMCPTNSMFAGSPDCPVFRGVLAVNPFTGDTFSWAVDANNQDQGVWQDECVSIGGICSKPLAFGRQWNTSTLEADTSLGASTILNGDYNLALAAVPSGQDTLLLAGDNDLWKCSLAMGCTWRNTTNTATCMSAQVGPFQHALEWNGNNPLEIFLGNDSGLWRSLDAIGESGSTCAVADSTHWQNLNGGLGSLAEVESMSVAGATPYTMMAGLGANGTAGVKETSGVTRNWPEILGGEGGPVAIDPSHENNWYANNGAGVAIHLCAGAAPCTPPDFGLAPAVSNAAVGNDGLTMTQPAPFLVDPVDPTQLLIGTCRMWRGPASGAGWRGANAITAMLDGNVVNPSCSGNATIRSMASMALPGGGEAVYVGVYGTADGGATVAGHVMRTTMDGNGTWSAWQDLTLNPITNDRSPMNMYGFDVSSVTLDPHDASGATVYVTLLGFPNPMRPLAEIYRSTDAGMHWQVIDSNLRWAPANALAVDPVDGRIVYVATDVGVFSTQTVASCAKSGVSCWAPYGAGLPMAPVVALSASPAAVNPAVLVAGTYGRGVWQIPLLTAAAPFTLASASPGDLMFAAQIAGTVSLAQTVTFTNTGLMDLLPTSISVAGDFEETDDCEGATIAAGAACSIQVVFSPSVAGTRTGQVTVDANVQGGSIAVSLSGTGVTAGFVQLSPARIDFGQVPVGTSSLPLGVTVENTGGNPVPIKSIGVSSPFKLTANSCGTPLLPNYDCVLMIELQPTEAGPLTGILTIVDEAGTQTVQLIGTGTSSPTDTLSSRLLSFPATVIGQSSGAQTIVINNTGSNPLVSIQVSVAGAFLQSNNCTTQLAPESSCSISVQFLPDVHGPQTGSLTISDILRTQTVALSGTGVLSPMLSVHPASLDFPGQQVGLASAPGNISITNAGEASMANVGFQVTGPSAPSFSTGSSTCASALAAGASCVVPVIFTPSWAGAAAAALTVSSSTPGVKVAIVPLSGTGLSSTALSATPAKLTFAPTAIGQSSTAQAVTITNGGEIEATGLNVSASGQFLVSQNTCGKSLPAGSSCMVGVSFAPMQSGASTGSLTILSTSLSTPTSVVLTGTGGLNGAMQLQPSQLNFPMTGVGSTSAAIPLTVTNTSASVSLDNLALSVSPGFTLTTGTCGSSLPAGTNCTVGVAFIPAKSGAQTGTLTIASSALAGNLVVPLSGAGFDFTSVNSGAASHTVAGGQAANYAITLTPSGGSATFTFKCNTLPSYAACVFNPPSNEVAANATGTEILQITTTQTTAMAAPPPSLTVWRAVSSACGLLLLPLATRKRRQALTALAVILLMTVVLSSCAGSGGGSGGADPTDHTVLPGTYAVVLVVTANSVQHTVTLNMVVD